MGIWGIPAYISLLFCSHRGCGEIADLEKTEQRRLVLPLLRAVEAEPFLLGASAHLIAIARTRASRFTRMISAWALWSFARHIV